MNFYFKNTVGVFGGEHAFAVVLVKSGLFDVKFEKCETYEFDKTASKEKRKTELVSKVKNFIQKNRVDAADLSMGISRRVVMLREIEFPSAVKENLGATLEFELEKYIPLSVEDIYFDYKILSQDKKRKTFKVLVAIVKKEDLDPFFELMDEIKLKVEAAAIDISTTAFLSVVSKCCHSRIADGSVIACAGIDGFEIFTRHGTLYQSSKFFQTAPDATDGDDGSEELSPSDYYGEKVEAYIEEYTANGELDLYIGGALAYEQNVYQFSSEDMDRVKIQPVYFDTSLVPDWRCAEAAGLALKTAENKFSGFNLIPEDKRIKNGKKVYYYFAALLLGVLLTGMAWAGSGVLKNYIQSNIYDAKLAELSQEVAELEKTVDQEGLIEKKISRVSQFASEGASVTDILKELTQTIPESAWISEFEYSSKGLEISGYADSASKILTQLEKSPMFKDASFISSIRKRYGKEIFKIGFKID